MGFIADEPLFKLVRKPLWTQEEAIGLCVQIEAVCPEYGCHVALTGGTLYKEGPRKDLDLVFYRIRQIREIDIDGLFDALLQKVGIVRLDGDGWLIKAMMFDSKQRIDCFFPEGAGEEYDEDEDDD